MAHNGFDIQKLNCIGLMIDRISRSQGPQSNFKKNYLQILLYNVWQLLMCLLFTLISCTLSELSKLKWGHDNNDLLSDIEQSMEYKHIKDNFKCKTASNVKNVVTVLDILVPEIINQRNADQSKSCYDIDCKYLKMMPWENWQLKREKIDI